MVKNYIYKGIIFISTTEVWKSLKFQGTDTVRIMITGSVLEDKVLDILQNFGNHLCYESGNFHDMMLRQNSASVSNRSTTESVLCYDTQFNEYARLS